MRLELQVKVLRLEGVPLVSRMGLVIIELLLIGGQREENGSKKRKELQCNATTKVSMGEMDTGRECMAYEMKWKCLI